MKVYLTLIILPALLLISDGVKVTVDEFSISLESLKQLKVILDAAAESPRFRSSQAQVVCSDPQLPAEMAPLCSSPKAPALIRALESVAQNSVLCEICANVACSGC